MPAPKRPVGENAPLNVSAWGIRISAVNRYPLAKAKSAREPRIENCANSKAAVTSSVTKTMASKDGNSAFNSTSGRPANGAVTPNPASAAAATASADQLCRVVGGNSASH